MRTECIQGGEFAAARRAWLNERRCYVQQQPHAVYRLFDKKKKLLYVGCSANPGARRYQHTHGKKPWCREIASMVVDPPLPYTEAHAAETRAIEVERPPYNYAHQKENRRRVEIAARKVRRQAEVAARKAERRAKRYRCPRCGAPKEYKPGLAYCPSCMKKYRIERKLARGWTPKPNYHKGLCPCGQPRYVHPRSGRVDKSYCQKCKREKAARYNAGYRIRHPDKVRAAQMKWLAKNPEYQRKRQAAWTDEQRANWNAYLRKRYAAKVAASRLPAEQS